MHTVGVRGGFNGPLDAGNIQLCNTFGTQVNERYNQWTTV